MGSLGHNKLTFHHCNISPSSFDTKFKLFPVLIFRPNRHHRFSHNQFSGRVAIFFFYIQASPCNPGYSSAVLTDSHISAHNITLAVRCKNQGSWIRNTPYDSRKFKLVQAIELQWRFRFLLPGPSHVPLVADKGVSLPNGAVRVVLFSEFKNVLRRDSAGSCFLSRSSFLSRFRRGVVELVFLLRNPPRPSPFQREGPSPRPALSISFASLSTPHKHEGRGSTIHAKCRRIIHFQNTRKNDPRNIDNTTNLSDLIEKGRNIVIRTRQF